jgi:hypothetical protein
VGVLRGETAEGKPLRVINICGGHVSWKAVNEKRMHESTSKRGQRGWNMMSQTVRLRLSGSQIIHDDDCGI